MVKIFDLPKTDEKILALVRCGDNQILTHLYEKNKRMVIKYITENNGTVHDASECLQEALIILWENVRKGKFVLTSKLSTYIYSIVKNNWLRELQRRQRHTELNPDARNPGENIEKSAEDQELIEIVQACMKRLSTLCQQILTLYYYDDKSMMEISRITGLANENVAKSKKYQCKKDLEIMIKSIYQKSEEW